jgi:uncharacterized delta-60 repeat protein
MKSFWALILLILLLSFKASSQSGSVDSSFNTNFDCDNTSSMDPVKIQRNGKIIVGGNFRIQFITGKEYGYFVRLNPDGSLDPSFKIGSGIIRPVRKISFFTDDKILVSGSFEHFNGIKTVGIVLLNSNGSINTDFHSPYLYLGEIHDVAIHQQKILIYGTYPDMNSIYRLNLDGKRDRTFERIKLGFNGQSNPLEVFPNGDIYVYLFEAVSRNWKVIRYNKNGELDSNYRISKDIFINALTDMVYSPDNKLFLVGANLYQKDSNYKELLKINEDGTLDKEFNLDNRFKKLEICKISATYIQRNGKILLGGTFKGFLGNETIAMIRLNPNGSIDTGFHLNSNGFNDEVLNIESYGDDKLIITGKFSAYGSVLTNNIALLEIDDIETKEDKLTFKIVSNPSNGLFWVEANQVLKEITIFDAYGKQVYDEQLNTPNVQIDISNKANGVYFINCQSSSGNKMLKILKL